jgi:excisionase family DNA binding protein
MTTDPQYLSTSEVARRLRISPDRVRQLARSGRLPPDQETELGRLWLTETIGRFEATRTTFGRFEEPDRAGPVAP